MEDKESLWKREAERILEREAMEEMQRGQRWRLHLIILMNGVLIGVIAALIASGLA